MDEKEEYKISDEFKPFWEALQKSQSPLDERIVRQFENIEKRIVNANKRAKKSIYSQNTKNIIRRFQIAMLMHLQKELWENNGS